MINIISKCHSEFKSLLKVLGDYKMENYLNTREETSIQKQPPFVKASSK